MNLNGFENRIGAWPTADGVFFRVWAPTADQVDVAVFCGDSNTDREFFRMQPQDRGYHSLFLGSLSVGSRYKFRLNENMEYPDPASRYQPEGPYGPSEVVRPEFEWTDQDWRGVPLKEWVIYELHVGTFTEEGTFKAVETKLDHLKTLGITTLEIMPVAQFSGERNWGYDGVGLFSPQNSYSKSEPISPLALKSLVNRCHQNGLAVILDVVYNHLGPEGNYLSQFGPYFQDRYKTPWGDAVNFDGEFCEEVRHFFLENARQWLEEFHFDGLRLDAVHAIFDTSALPFLEQLSRMKTQLEEKLGRSIYLIAESDANDSRLLAPPEQNGLGLDGQWADDLHHTLHGLLTGERNGYFEDYGSVEQLKTIFERGLYFEGQYSPSRKRCHGRSYESVERHRLTVCSQNHDQIGNRKEGDRLICLVGEDKQKLAAACVFLSGCLPLIFMGEEMAETAPFLYFVDHVDEELREAVRKGRSEEFKAFAWQGGVPHPGALETYQRSKLNWERFAASQQAKDYFDYYKDLIALSRSIRRRDLFSRQNIKVDFVKDKVLKLSSAKTDEAFVVFLSFSEDWEEIHFAEDDNSYQVLLNSSEKTSFNKESVRLSPYSVFVKGQPPQEVL